MIGTLRGILEYLFRVAPRAKMELVAISANWHRLLKRQIRKRSAKSPPPPTINSGSRVVRTRRT
jgi:hypothetical protein